MTMVKSLPSPSLKILVEKECSKSHRLWSAAQGCVLAHRVASLCPLVLHMMFFKQQGTSCTTQQVSTRPVADMTCVCFTFVEIWSCVMEWSKVSRTFHK